MKHFKEEDLLNKKIAFLRNKARGPLKKPQKKNNDKKSLLFFRVGTEFISAIIAGVLLGLAIDHFCNTRPFGVIILFLMGSIAGFLNILRVFKKDIL